MWGEDPEPYLQAGVNLVPLAPLASVSEAELRPLVERMALRINAEPAHRAAKLWTATYLLMGLCYSDELVSQLLEGVLNMHESTTYQAILREGRNEGLNEGRNEGLIEGRLSEARRLLLLQGEVRFGAADEATRRQIEGIRGVERLERIIRRVLDTNVSDWKALLHAPDLRKLRGPSYRNRRRFRRRLREGRRQGQVKSDSLPKVLFMRISVFSRTLLASLLAVAALERTVAAQWIGAGSTIEGDYLRGVGIAAMGMGIYNEKTAIAEFDQPRHGDSL